MEDQGIEHIETHSSKTVTQKLNNQTVAITEECHNEVHSSRKRSSPEIIDERRESMEIRKHANSPFYDKKFDAGENDGLGHQNEHLEMTLDPKGRITEISSQGEATGADFFEEHLLRYEDDRTTTAISDKLYDEPELIKHEFDDVALEEKRRRRLENGNQGALLSPDEGKLNNERSQYQESSYNNSNGRNFHGNISAGGHKYHDSSPTYKNTMSLQHDMVMKELEHFGKLGSVDQSAHDRGRNSISSEEDEVRSYKLVDHLENEHNTDGEHETSNRRRLSLHSEDGPKGKVSAKHKSVDESGRFSASRDHFAAVIRPNSSGDRKEQILNEAEEEWVHEMEESRKSEKKDKEDSLDETLKEDDVKRPSMDGSDVGVLPLDDKSHRLSATSEQNFDRRKSSADAQPRQALVSPVDSERRRSSTDAFGSKKFETDKGIGGTDEEIIAMQRGTQFSQVIPVVDDELEQDQSKGLEIEIFDTFKLFDYDANGTIDIKDLGTVLRCLNLNPTQAEVEDLRRQVKYTSDFNGDSKKITWSKFYPEVVKIMEGGNYKPATEEELISAFSYLDVEKKGYLTIDQLKHFLLNMGEPLNDDEFEQMLYAGAVDVDPDCFNYLEYAKRLVG